MWLEARLPLAQNRLQVAPVPTTSDETSAFGRDACIIHHAPQNPNASFQAFADEKSNGQRQAGELLLRHDTHKEIQGPRLHKCSMMRHNRARLCRP